MRSFALGLLAGTGIALGSFPASADSVTTRIEASAVYGAVIREERGVNVIRPLPPHDRVIVNPDNTPLSLGFYESHYHSSGPNYVSGGGGYAQPGYGGAWTGGHLRRRDGHGQGQNHPRPGSHGGGKP